MESLQEAQKALHWYREAVRVADLIAEEDEADAGLYRALYRYLILMLLSSSTHATDSICRMDCLQCGPEVALGRGPSRCHTCA